MDWRNVNGEWINFSRLECIYINHRQYDFILQQLGELQEEIHTLRKENVAFRKENASFRQENALLREENVKLCEENTLLRAENQKLLEENLALKQENATLKSLVYSQGLLIEEQRAEIEKLKTQVQQYAEAYEILSFDFKVLARAHYGKKSERYLEEEAKTAVTASLLTNQNSVNGSEDNNANNLVVTEEQGVFVSAHKRKKKGIRNVDLPRRIEIIYADDEERQCSCGKLKKVIRYEVRELIHYIPATFEIIEQRREVLGCNCLDSTITTAPVPLHILPKVGVTEEFLAFVVINKLVDRQPLYHLEKQLAARYRVNVTRKTMATWLIALVQPLQPLYNLLKDTVIDDDIASCDATPLQVLNEPDRAAETKSYMYCILGGSVEKPVVLYSYNDKLHKKFMADWFEGFSGTIHMDCDNFFELLTSKEDVYPSFCNAHARRKFEAVFKVAKKRGLAHEALDFYKRLYAIERFAKKNELTLEELHKIRQEKSKPIMEEFKKWLDEYVSMVLPKSPLGKSFAYTINHWEGFVRFLENPRLSIDNNHTEREIKPFVMARKAFLFANSVGGAHALAMHFSLIRTAIANKLEPYQYYVHILKEIPHCKTVEDYEKLLPCNVDLTKMQD